MDGAGMLIMATSGRDSTGYHEGKRPCIFRMRIHGGFVSFYQAPALFATMFGRGFMPAG
jgi:hypothetical protein